MYECVKFECGRASAFQKFSVGALSDGYVKYVYGKHSMWRATLQIQGNKPSEQPALRQGRRTLFLKWGIKRVVIKKSTKQEVMSVPAGDELAA